MSPDPHATAGLVVDLGRADGVPASAEASPGIADTGGPGDAHALTAGIVLWGVVTVGFLGLAPTLGNVALALPPLLVLGLTTQRRAPRSRVADVVAVRAVAVPLALLPFGFFARDATGAVPFAVALDNAPAAGATTGALLAFLVATLGPAPRTRPVGLLAASRRVVAWLGGGLLLALVAYGVAYAPDVVLSPAADGTTTWARPLGRTLPLVLLLFVGGLLGRGRRPAHLRPRDPQGAGPP